MVGYGPILDEPEDKTMEAHKPLRDEVGAAQRKLAEDLKDAGHDVMDEVRRNAPLDEEVSKPVWAAFAARFPAV
jgi:hypothetical protein